jgi:hypothetical protein
VTLGPCNCGDGSEEGKIWFRIVDKASFASEKQRIFQRDEKAMLARNHCVKGEVRGDGNCHRRCIASILFGKGADTSEKIKQVQYVIAAGLEKYSDDLAAMALKFAADDNFGAYCLARAKLLRSIDSTKDCSRDEWGGGEHGCDNFVLARALNGRVVISTPGQPTLHVYNANFDLTDEPIAHFILRPGDIPMSHVWNGIHFEPYIRQSNFLLLFPPLILSCLILFLCASISAVPDDGFTAVAGNKKRKKQITSLLDGDMRKEMDELFLKKTAEMRMLFQELIHTSTNVLSAVSTHSTLETIQGGNFHLYFFNYGVNTR